MILNASVWRWNQSSLMTWVEMFVRSTRNTRILFGVPCVSSCPANTCLLQTWNRTNFRIGSYLCILTCDYLYNYHHQSITLHPHSHFQHLLATRLCRRARCLCVNVVLDSVLYCSCSIFCLAFLHSYCVSMNLCLMWNDFEQHVQTALSYFSKLRPRFFVNRNLIRLMNPSIQLS